MHVISDALSTPCAIEGYALDQSRIFVVIRVRYKAVKRLKLGLNYVDWRKVDSTPKLALGKGVNGELSNNTKIVGAPL